MKRLLPFFCASACATVSPAELQSVRDQLRAVQAENSQLALRLTRLETDAAIGKAAAPAAPTETQATQAALTPAAAPVQSPVQVPNLTVVKLKPKRSAPPPLATEVPFREPAVLAEAHDAPNTAEEAAPAPFEAAWEHALGLLKTGSGDAAVSEFEALAAQHPRHPKADNALVFAGIGLLGLGRLDAALARFTKVLSTYPAGDARAEALLRMGECYYRLGKTREARAAYRQLQDDFHGTPQATDAAQRLTSLASISPEATTRE